jgi:hypothetical protein
VSFGGISAVVMAGTNINEMNFKKMPSCMVHWATLYGSEIWETHYITQLLIAGGCRSDDIASVIYAKPEQKLKKITSISVERKVSSQRALMEERPTIIFNTAQALHQFVAYFEHTAVWQEYPKIQVGFNEAPFTGSIAVMAEQHEYMNYKQFKAQHTIEYVDSNESNQVQQNLVLAKAYPEKSTRLTQEEKCYAAIQVLKSAKRAMKKPEFQGILNMLVTELAIPMKRKRENETDMEDQGFAFFDCGNAGVESYTNLNEFKSGLPTGTKKEDDDMEITG